MGLQSEPPLHREVIETRRIPQGVILVEMSEPPLHREVIETFFAAVSAASSHWSEPPLHREVIEPKNPDIRKDTGIFSIKKLKNSAQPGICSERW